MNSRRLLQYLLIFVVSLAVLTGCGNSSRSGEDDNGSTLVVDQERNSSSEDSAITTNESNSSTTTEVSETEQNITKTKGYLIDSPLEGVNYICADGSQGITDSEGIFECSQAPITFKVGNLTLGTLNAFTTDSKVYLQDLLGLARTNYSDSRLKLLARFMQSLDDDGVINTKITITADIRNRLTTKQNFADMSESDIEALLSGIGKSLVNECGALKHLGDTSVECESDGSYHVVSSPVSGGGGNNPPVTSTSKIKLLSPSLQKGIDYNYLTLEVDGNVADVKAKVNGVEYIGVKNGSSSGQSTKLNGSKYAKTIKATFFIHNVALQKGKNTIELIADGGSEKRTIEIDSEGKGIPPIGVNADKREGFEKLDTTINIQTTLSVSEYMLDKENDGVIDESKGDGSFAVSYNAEGRFFPMATVKTSDGVLYSTQKNISLDVKAKPTEVKIDAVTEQINDLERFGGYVWALSNTQIYKIDENNESKVTTISLSGVSNPQGFCYDDKANLYIADSGNNRVIKLLASSNYQPDTFISNNGSFGTQGSGKGQFENPVDCMVTSSIGKIYVVDNGNNRIEIFNRAGIYTGEINGTNTNTGVLNNPQGILASAQTPIVVDSGNNLIREFSADGDREFYLSTQGLLNNPIKITDAPNGYLIADSDNNRIVLLSRNLDKLKFQLPLQNSPQNAIFLRNSEDKFYVAYKNMQELKKISTNSDVKNETPEKIVEKFVNALLSKDKNTMYLYVKNKTIVDDIFNDIDTWIKFFNDNDIAMYHTYSKDNILAGVEILFNQTSNKFVLSLIKFNKTWFIKNF